MPVILKITQANGKTETLNLPVNIWQRGGVWTFVYPSTSATISLELDPTINCLMRTGRIICGAGSEVLLISECGSSISEFRIAA